METELYATHYIYRVKGRAVASIHRVGHRGIIYGMQGKGLLVCLMQDLLEGNLRDAGIRTLEGFVNRAVATAIEITANEHFKITYEEECLEDNRETVWIIVERIDE